MAIQLRSYMLTYMKIFLIVFIYILYPWGIAISEVISPPKNIPFADDVVIEKYTIDEPLKLFRYTGKWEAKKIGEKISIIGTSNETPIYLISNDYLSRKPKSFKFDFIVHDINKESGFLYGENGILLKGDRIFPAKFQGKMMIITGNPKFIQHSTSNNIYTLDIDTGYDPIGGETRVCTIYINGVGITLNCPNEDKSFGVYIGPQNSITIGNIRWGIGSL